MVSDRIRENFRKIRRGTPYEIFNVSLTQTLHRTLITSGTTLMVILMLFLFGGPILEGFSLTMLIGVSIGTASSIYVASALALKLGMKREHLIQQKVEKEGAAGIFLPATKPADSMLSGALPYTASELTNEQEEV